METNVEQRVYDGRAILMMGANQEDWWVGKATLSTKVSGFSRRGGGGNFKNQWNTGFSEMTLSVELASLTRVEMVDILGLPLASGSSQIFYQDDTVPATPGPYTITLDHTAADVDWITVFAHNGDGAYSLMGAKSTAPATGQYTPGTATLAFNAAQQGQQVRIRAKIDSTAGESAIMPSNYIPNAIEGCFYTSETVEGDDSTAVHGELWEFPSLALTDGTTLNWGGSAEGAEGEMSTIVYNIQSTNLPTYSRF